MKIRVSEATGVVLDWMVAKAEGLTPTLHKNPYGYWVLPNLPGSYSTDWSQGGPIIERERITTIHNGIHWCANIYYEDKAPECGYGPTALIAAMRCFCVSRLGEEVEVPQELL